MARKTYEESEKYWDNFYKTFKEKRPSAFAIWCYEKYLYLFPKHKYNMVDIGAGNLRDTKFFNKLGFKVVPVDSNDICSGFGIDEMINSGIKTDIAYCRFLFHAIPEDIENKLISWLSVNSIALMAEFRSDSDKSILEKDDSHYRRLINGNKFLIKLINSGFGIFYFEERNGMSDYKGEDPVLIRVVASRVNEDNN